MKDKLRRKIYKKYYYGVSKEKAEEIAILNCKLLQIPIEDISESFEIKETKKGIVIKSPYKSVLDLDDTDLYDNIFNNTLNKW